MRTSVPSTAAVATPAAPANAIRRPVRRPVRIGSREQGRDGPARRPRRPRPCRRGRRRARRPSGAHGRACVGRTRGDRARSAAVAPGDDDPTVTHESQPPAVERPRGSPPARSVRAPVPSALIVEMNPSRSKASSRPLGAQAAATAPPVPVMRRPEPDSSGTRQTPSVANDEELGPHRARLRHRGRGRDDADRADERHERCDQKPSSARHCVRMLAEPRGGLRRVRGAQIGRPPPRASRPGRPRRPPRRRARATPRAARVAKIAASSSMRVPAGRPRSCNGARSGRSSSCAQPLEEVAPRARPR